MPKILFKTPKGINKMTVLKQNDDPVMTRASEWHAMMHSGEVNDKTRRAFEAWLHSDRENKRVYREFEQVYCDLDFVSVAAGIDIADALGRSKLKWPGKITEWISDALRPPVFAKGIAGAVLAAALLFIVAPPMFETPANGLRYSTGIAEIRTITLEDGSTVTLGAKSVLATNFTDSSRQVTLLSGDAFFDITKNKTRPFYVSVNDTLVRVVGTRFDVRYGADKIHVAVEEGIVEVMKPQKNSDDVEKEYLDNVDKRRLIAGEMVSAQRHHALSEVQKIKDIRPGAWRFGTLAYHDARLMDIIADVNRYSARPVRLATLDIENLRATIAFKADEVDQFLDVISKVHRLDVDRSSDAEIILRRKQ